MNKSKFEEKNKYKKGDVVYIKAIVKNETPNNYGDILLSTGDYKKTAEANNEMKFALPYNINEILTLEELIKKSENEL